jgi:hypothetical protein
MPLTMYQKGAKAGARNAREAMAYRKRTGKRQINLTSKQKKAYALAKKKKQMPGARPFVETKFIHSLPSTDPIVMNAGTPSAGHIAGTTVIVPECWNQGWHQGLSRSEITGRAIYPRYLTMKLSMDTAKLPAGQYNLRCIVGFCTESLQGLEGATLTPSHFSAKVIEQLKLSGMLGNYLDFPIKRKGIKILKDFRVRGNRNASLASFMPSPAPHNNSNPPNPINSFTFQWPMGTKTWTTPNDATPPVFFPSRSWIPFVAFYSAELATMTESPESAPEYKASSKLWYTDQ